MNLSDETWTSAHDLALVFIALAYGADHDLSDDELDFICDALREWHPNTEDADLREVIMEAMSVYLEADAEAEVGRAMHDLREALSTEELRHALEQVVGIAEADGIMLNTERSLIATLGAVWSLRTLSERLIDESTAAVEKIPGWGLLHDLALIYLVVAHSADDDLTESEIEVILERLKGWQPEAYDAEARAIVREALQLYADEPGREIFGQAMTALKEALTPIQRILVLDDLNQIACADGHLSDNERTLIKTLATAWDIKVRLSSNSQPSAS